ncbi:MAG: recombinase family protein [Firmicutes bacterium]|nr:recombinase family protein [Bacillota bacterium]
MKKWKLAIYRRRSFDEKREEESNSVTNQKKLIDDFLIEKKDLIICNDYVDDGYTGTDFNRPGYKKMLNDIRNGKINAVIVKDLSRLGRNYIQVGDFIDEIIPQYNLRFISINDNVDSYENPNTMSSLEIPLKNLMNEGYSKDSSKKMRTSLNASKKAGNFVGKVAPYGYIKDPEDKHKFLIDKDAAKIVKKIFDLVLKGYSKQEIAKELNNNHIITPSTYLKEKLNYNCVVKCNKWNSSMLDYILKNESYMGNLVQGKTTRISHKVHNVVRVSEDEWIKCDNHHEPIIDEEVYRQVQSILYNRNSKINKNGKYYKYTGFIKCADCGCNLYRITRTKHKKEQIYYYCSSYIRAKQCSQHYIKEQEVDEIVLKILNLHIDLVCDVSKKIEDTVSFSRIEYNAEVKKIRIVELNKGIEKYQTLLNEIIKDYELNYITQDDFERFNRKYLYEINNLKLEKEELEKSKLTSNKLKWLDKFKKIGKLDTIDRNVVNEFIDNILVNDDRSVIVNLKYKEQYEDAINYLKSKEI